MPSQDHYYGGLDARAVESQYYHHPLHEGSSVPFYSSGLTQYMARIEGTTYHTRTPDMPHVPLPQGQNHSAVDPHSMDAHHSFTPLVATQGTNYIPEANSIDREYALYIQMNPALPTPDAHYLPVLEGQNQGVFSDSQDTDDPSSAALGTPPLHPENNDNYGAGDDVAEDEAPPSATQDPGHFDFSVLVPPSMAHMSIFQMYREAGEETDPDLLHMHHIPVLELAQALHTLGCQPARIFAWMVKRFYKIEGFKCAYPDCTGTTVYQSKGALMKHIDSHFVYYNCTNTDCKSARLGSRYAFQRHMENKTDCSETVSRAATAKYPNVETNDAIIMHCVRRITQPHPWLSRDLF